MISIVCNFLLMRFLNLLVFLIYGFTFFIPLCFSFFNFLTASVSATSSALDPNIGVYSRKFTTSAYKSVEVPSIGYRKNKGILNLPVHLQISPRDIHEIKDFYNFKN
jgi:hypothetical protein